MPHITSLNLMKLKQSELLNFNKRILSMTRPCCSEHRSFQRYEEESNRLDELIKQKAFKESVSLRELDREADQAWAALNHHLRASVWHPRTEIREAAQKIYDVFTQTDNPTKLNYEQEYGALQALLMQLDALPVELFEKTHTRPYVQALNDAVSNFLSASENKIDILSQQQVGALKEAVTACHAAWQGLSRYLIVTAEFDENPEMIQVVDRINTLCVGIRRRLETRKRTGEDSTINVDAL